MRTHLALLRGINVGGNTKLAMADLKKIAADLGWSEVATLVNSGNVVFSASGSVVELESALATQIEQLMGRPIQTLVLTADEWRAGVAAVPYQPEELKFVHLQVHRNRLPDSVVAAVGELAAEVADDTEWTIDGRWFYVHTPRGLLQSKLFDKVGRLLPKDDPGTARNLNSARRLVELLDR